MQTTKRDAETWAVTATVEPTREPELSKDWRSMGALSIPEAGQALGVGRSLAFDLARRGDLPTIRLGRRRVVPVAALRRMLGES